ncbi:MAG: D-glycero-beta-D-manno-heptose 1,7-bisphosphate 7-phosphatase [Gammaproteobacteria bacterium]|nr:D-glycero-beta-D-manno-heptose-1,7-bisphosphate 7-phosphatase [Gammaproteobacteria bacterium]
MAESRPRRRLVVLDRDGVINADSDEYVKSPDEWHPLPGSLEAIARLHRAGFDVVVATNQSGVGRGLFSRETLEAIHARMRDAVAAAGGRIAGIYYCPHRPEDGCTCRKPKPGLLRRIEADFGQPLDGVPFVGDKLADVEAALAVGARPIFVGTPRDDTERSRLAELGVETHPDLSSAADALLAR